MIDMYRHLENTIALGDDDDYDIKNLSLTGIKDIMEEFQNALSASTSIPSTVLFGRSPAGLSSTGKADMENYYNMVERIQRQNLKPQLMRLVYILSLASDYNLNLPAEWNIEFNPLWNASEKEEAEVAKLQADTMAQAANAAKVYIDTGVLDALEVRNTLKEQDKYLIDDSLDGQVGNVESSTEEDVALPNGPGAGV